VPYARAAFVMEQGAPRPDTGIPVGEVDRFSREGKGLLAMLSQDKASIVDSLTLCMICSDG